MYKNKMMFHIWEGRGRRVAMDENNSASRDGMGRDGTGRGLASGERVD